jgi:cell division septal protein FtsQ
MKHKMIETVDEYPPKSKAKFSRLFLLLLLILAGMVFFNSNLFTLREVTVRGNRGVSTAEILAISALPPGQTIFQINCGALIRRLRQDPRVASVEAIRQLPDRLIINLRERQPICLVVYHSGLLMIGEEAVVIGPPDSRRGLRLPVVRGIELQRLHAGETIRAPGFQPALMILRLADQNLTRSMKEVDLAAKRIILESASGEQIIVELGNLKELEAKIANLRAIAANTELAVIKLIDLRAPDAPTVIRR